MAEAVDLRADGRRGTLGRLDLGQLRGTGPAHVIELTERLGDDRHVLVVDSLEPVPWIESARSTAAMRSR